MSKHSRRSEQVQSSRGRAGELTYPEKGPAGEAAPAASPTADREAVGKYWVVIVLWAIGFVALIGFELFAAIFRR